MNPGASADAGAHTHAGQSSSTCDGSAGADLGFTHVAIVVADLDATIDFYERYAGLDVVHRRHTSTSVAWMSDGRRPFVIVAIEGNVTHRLGGMTHLGVAAASTEDVDRSLARAEDEGRVTYGPFDTGPPVGYFGVIVDPDGHHLEISHGQHVAFTVDHHGGAPSGT